MKTIKLQCTDKLALVDDADYEKVQGAYDGFVLAYVFPEDLELQDG